MIVLNRLPLGSKPGSPVPRFKHRHPGSQQHTHLERRACPVPYVFLRRQRQRSDVNSWRELFDRQDATIGSGAGVRKPLIPRTKHTLSIGVSLRTGLSARDYAFYFPSSVVPHYHYRHK